MILQQPDIATTWAGWETYYTMKCEQIGRDFATAGITVVPGFEVVPTKADTPVKAHKIVTHDGLAIAEEDSGHGSKIRTIPLPAVHQSAKFNGIHGLDMLQPAPKMKIVHSDTAGNPIPKGTYQGFEISFPLPSGSRAGPYGMRGRGRSLTARSSPRSSCRRSASVVAGAPVPE